MFKKTLLACTLCIIPFAVNADDQANLHIINMTIVPQGFLSLAKVQVIDKVYEVDSIGFNDNHDVTAIIPANENAWVNINQWLFGNGIHTVDPSCNNIMVNAKPGETKTMLIRGLPTDYINSDSKIVCSIN